MKFIYGWTLFHLLRDHITDFCITHIWSGASRCDLWGAPYSWPQPLRPCAMLTGILHIRVHFVFSSFSLSTLMTYKVDSCGFEHALSYTEGEKELKTLPPCNV